MQFLFHKNKVHFRQSCILSIYIPHTISLYYKIYLKSELANERKLPTKFHKVRVGIARSITIEPQIGLYTYNVPIYKFKRICTKLESYYRMN